MVPFWMKKTACALVMLASVGSAAADVTISQSNSPRAILDAELIELFGGERAAFETVSPNQFSRLQNEQVSRSLDVTPFGFAYRSEYLAGLPSAKGDAQWRCLSEALYFEARGENVVGQFAVAEVILNRVDSSRYPSTLCRVIRQGTGAKFQCQFTYTCDGLSENINERAAWHRVGKIARIMIDGKDRTLTDGATHYHTKAVNPRWARVFPRTATIGAHHFYRQPMRTASKS